MNSDDKELVDRLRTVSKGRVQSTYDPNHYYDQAQTYLLTLILQRLESIDDSLACIMQNTEKND